MKSEETINFSKEELSEIKNYFEILIYFSNEKVFQVFKNKFYSDIEEENIVKSFILFVCCIIDKLCGKIAEIQIFFNNERDWNLYRGYNFPIHYSVFCNNSLQGKICYLLYDFCHNTLLKISDMSEFFQNMKDFNREISDLSSYILNIKTKDSKLYISYEVIEIINTKPIPGHFPKDLQHIFSHFFTSNDDLLNFLKNEQGLWISSVGFFIGISFLFRFLLKENKFSENSKKIIIKDLPFTDFSLDRHGYFGQKKYSLYPEKFADFDKIFVYTFVTEHGPLQIFSLQSKEILTYGNTLEKIIIKNFRLDFNNEEKIIKLDSCKLSIKANHYLESLFLFEEKYILPKLFDYNHIISISNEDGIMRCSNFDLISRGQLNRKNSDDKIELIVLQNLPKELELDYLDNNLIKEVKSNSKYHFLNNSEHVPMDMSVFDVVIGNDRPKSDDSIPIYCGYFFNIAAISMLSNHSYAIGSFLFGGNDDGTSASETQNFDSLVDFINENQDEIELKTYVLKNNYLVDLFHRTRHNMIIPIQPPSPFDIQFSSLEEISDTVLSERYNIAFDEFKQSFQDEKSSNKRKKDSLENLSELLFKMLPGVEVIGRDFLTTEGSEEIDLIVRLKPDQSTFYDLFEILGPNFLVECKNIGQAVSSAQVRNFGDKLMSSTYRTGILISRKGLTGKKPNERARQTVRDFANRGKIILSLDLDDLELIAKGKNPISIIRKAYSNFFFQGLIK